MLCLLCGVVLWHGHLNSNGCCDCCAVLCCGMGTSTPMDTVIVVMCGAVLWHGISTTMDAVIAVLCGAVLWHGTSTQLNGCCVCCGVRCCGMVPQLNSMDAVFAVLCGAVAPLVY
jgi:hypothetical protein